MNNVKKIILGTLIFCIGLGVFTGLFISWSNSNNKNEKGTTLESQNTEVSTKSTVSMNKSYMNPKLNSIGPATKIIKKQIYTAGEPYEKIQEEKSTEDIIGMDKELFEEYAKKKGYVVEEFNGSKVVISEKINKWPKGLYVLKAINEHIAIYKVDESGNLSNPQVTEVVLNQVSEIEKPILIKGKVYNSLDTAEETIAEYDS